MQQPNCNDSTRLDRIERSIEALASRAADFFSKLTEQQAKHEARMAEIQATHEARMNDHEEALLDHEEEHRRILRAQVVIADELRKTSVAHWRTEAASAQASERLNGLIAVVDDFIRWQPKQ